MLIVFCAMIQIFLVEKKGEVPPEGTHLKVDSRPLEGLSGKTSVAHTCMEKLQFLGKF